MKRRAFLGGLGVVGGAALVGARGARGAAKIAVLDRLKQARVGITARLGDGAGGVLGEAPLGDAGAGRRPGRAGALGLRAAPVAGTRDAVDLFAVFRAKTGAPPAVLSLAFDLGVWSIDNHLLLPGACYAGNRFESRFVGYPPLLSEPADIGPHVPPIISDIPRLNLHPGPSRLELAAGDLATPALAIFAPASKLALILLVDPATPLGPTGFTLEESDDRSRAVITVAAPFMRENRRGSNAAPPAPPEAPPASRPGEAVTLRARLLFFDCPSLAALHDRLFGARKALTGATAHPHLVPFSAAFAAHEARVNARWRAAPGFLATGAGQSAYATWQSGWCGGVAGLVPLLTGGAATSRERALQTVSFVLDGGQSPAGFFHGVSDGKDWFDDGFTAPLPPSTRTWPPRAALSPHPRWHLVRRSADTLDALVKVLAWRDRQAAAPGGPLVDPAAIPSAGKGARLCADALVRVWERHKQLGQFVDIESGDVVVGGSSSAGLAPAALARASVYFNEPRYLQVARDAAFYFFERFVDVGLTCGGPGDALQCPDSQSAAALLESFVTLFETTREPIWIDRAQAAAHLLATWVVSYDAPPSPRGCPAAGGVRATGAVLSDAQSRSGAPGYVLSSGAALFRLFRATGERALLELLRDTVHNLAQYLPGEANATAPPPARAPNGLCARADSAAWAGANRLFSPVIPWDGLFDAIALLAYSEIPGVYAQPDAGLLFAFDHVDARIKEHVGDRLVVALHNPTSVDATVRLYAESTADAAGPLPPDAISTAPTAAVAAGATVEVVMPPQPPRR